jgi:hypothetical protein
LQEFASPVAKIALDRVEPVVEKPFRRLDFGLRQAGGRDNLSWRDLHRRSNAGIACWIKLEITSPSFSNHSRYGTREHRHCGQKITSRQSILPSHLDPCILRSPFRPKARISLSAGSRCFACPLENG